MASVTAAVASVGAQLLTKKPGQIGSVNAVTLGVNQPIPYSMGRAFIAGAQLHDVGYGGRVDKVDNPYLSRVWVWSAGGPVEAVDDFLVDFQPVLRSGTSALGYYAGWLNVDIQSGARPELAALAGPYGAIPDWGSAYKLSGYAAGLITMRFDKKGKVWANGVPVMGAVGRWARVYDMRKDGTYPGGSGAHRFGDEETFEYDPNAALNALTYARGRFAVDAEGNETAMVVGCGFPADSIDWPAWTAWANVCEANGWNVGGTVYDGPGISRWDNLKKICLAGAGVPCFSAGKLSVRFQSPKVALDTITADDLADGEYLAPGMQTYRNRVKTIVPKYRSEANKWEMVQSAAVSLDGSGSNGFEEEELALELVTDKDQAAELGAYELYGRQELSGITLPCKPRLWEYRLGEALQLDLPELGLNHLAVIAALSKDISTGIVSLTFESETTAKHAFALGQTGTAPPPPTLLPPGAADEAAWHNAGYGDLDAPDAGDWSLSTTVQQVGSTIVASLIVDGTVADPLADQVVFETRVYDAADGPDDNWSGASTEPATITRKPITGIVPTSDYEVSISYSAGGLVGARLILGPVGVYSTRIDTNRITADATYITADRG